MPIALFYLTVYGYSNNVYIAGVIFADIEGFTRLSETLASAGER